MAGYVLSFIITGLVVIIVILAGLYIKMRIKMKEVIKFDTKVGSLDFSNRRVEYTQSMMLYIRDLTMQVASIQFRNFIDGHDLSKVTKATMSKLVEDTAIKVNKSIYLNNIKFDDLLFTEDFYNNYIIDVAMISIKELLDKVINTTEEV
jgi:hypothetical protein